MYEVQQDWEWGPTVSAPSVFDGRVALDIAGLVLREAEPLTLDFRNVIEVHTLALAYLAKQVAPKRVSVRRAREHHRPLLRRLGLESP